MQMPSTKTLYSYWNTIRGSRSAPDRRDIDPTRIREALANTFILELDDTDRFSFRLAGSHLCTSYCRELKNRSFTGLWHERDMDAVDTLIRAVTEDHAVALVTFQGSTALQTKVSFETILMPLRHNGSTHTRVLGAGGYDGSDADASVARSRGKYRPRRVAPAVHWQRASRRVGAGAGRLGVRHPDNRAGRSPVSRERLPSERRLSVGPPNWRSASGWRPTISPEPASMCLVSGPWMSNRGPELA